MKRSGFKPKAPAAKRERVYPTAIPASQQRQASYTGTTTAAPKDPKPVRSEAYRRLVAAMPCAYCGTPNRSQHAHENEAKAKGRKLDDRRAMPLCADDVGKHGCHGLFDRYALLGTRDAHTEAGKRWAAQTREAIEAAGLWPEKLPRLRVST